ncbi:hypothetical protein [Glycomyces harbinensis]|uniref:Uncharacterized protein n=1 Tax=Glycomyces harbinensis TaxID=58114 RepID=A0A1G6V1N4_9ACTN|nr:hypothetical protein [Glycomyces harbinensis]SDD47530.1 hypothetical protein SAMN05216270_104162 [Glycomyces harbinensis]
MAAESNASARSAETDKLWNETGVDPVELHLGKDSGFTLRAYRMSDTLPGAKAAEEPETDADEAAAKEEDAPVEDAEGRPEADEAAVPEDEDAPEPDASAFEDDEEPEAEVEEDALDAAPEEVPVFLTRKGKLLVFREPEALVAYVRENDDHDLAVIDEYAELQERLTADDVSCDEDDTYELDLVVANLRGGHDAWEPELLIKAAEVGRDLGYALKNDSIVGALSPGSPLDDLDETFRVVVEGGLRGKLAKRRLRKNDSQQAAIAWRGVIAKVNDHVDWRG